MDFENYTIGSLVPGRRNYDSEQPEYRKVVGQILWRLYDLGFSLEAFGDVDQQIARLRHAPGRDAARTERYGKKYAWIAYFEIAGLRADLGLLETEYHREPRISDVDIEPSFPPERRAKRPEFVPALIRSEGGSAIEWFREGPTPFFGDLIVRTDIGRVSDEWILLEGSLRESRGPHQVYAHFVSFLVDTTDAARLAEAGRSGHLGNDYAWVPEDHYLFAGEVPWSDLLPPTEPTELPVVVGRKTVTETIPETGAAHVELLEWLAAHAAESQEETEADESDAAHGEVSPSPRVKTVTETRTVEREILETVAVTVIPTCRYYSWGSNHTTTAEDRHFTTLARQISEAEGLHTRPDEWELFDPSGTAVSRNFMFGEPFGDGGSLSDEANLGRSGCFRTWRGDQLEFNRGEA
jgi:hypothetical protein